MATRKEQEEVDRLLRSVGVEPQMVKRTREAAKTARFRTQTKATQYRALRELARKRKVGRTKDALSAEAQRLEGEQARRAAPKADTRTEAQKAADKTRAEFQADVVKSVRRGSRERPERERSAAEKERKAREAKAVADKKAAIEAKKAKVAMMEERQRKAGEKSAADATGDWGSTGRKAVKRSERLTRQEKERLKSDPDKLARLEAMVGKGLISKSTRKAKGPAQDEDLEEWLKGQKSWLEEDREEERKAKGRKAKPGKRKAMTEEEYRRVADRNVRMAADQAESLRPSERTPRASPGEAKIGKTGLTRDQFLAKSKAAQIKAAKEQLSDDQWDRWTGAGFTALELALIVGTGAGGILWGIGRRAVTVAAKKAAQAAAKRGARAAAESATRAKARQAAQKKAYDTAQKKAGEKAQAKAAAEAREKAARKAKEEAKRKADEEAKRAQRNARARERRRQKKESKERATREAGQDWQQARDARGGNWSARQQAAANKKAKAWTKRSHDYTKAKLREIYDKFNLGVDRGPSASMTLEELKQYIAEAIRAGAPI